MTRTLLLTCGLSAGLAAATLAGPINKSWVAPDSTWVVHIDVDAMRASTIGTFVAEHRKDLDLTGLDEFKAETGIDPWADIKGVTVFGTKPDPHDGVAIVTTSDAVDGALTKLLEKEKGLTAVTEDGLTLYTWTEHGSTRYGHVRPGAKPDERIVLAAVTKPLLLDAINRLADPGVAATQPPKSGAVSASPRRGSVLFVSVAAMDGMHLPDSSMMLQKMKAVRIDCGEAEGALFGELSVDAGTAEDATSMVQMAQGGMGFARLCASSDPELKSYLKAFDWVTLSRNERTATAVIKCPSSEVREFLTGALEVEKASNAAKADAKAGTTTGDEAPSSPARKPKKAPPKPL